jgi:hypothetical protein
MTKHDAIETNGDNCLVSILFLMVPQFKCNSNLLTLVTNTPTNPMTSDQVFVMFMWTFLGIFGALTNQFHKWAHTYQPPTVVRWLQQYGIILGRKGHNIHHKSPFACHYCITTGWLNPLLDAIHFWRGLELAISKVTGLVPREDDQNWNDHLELLNKDK